MSFFIKWHIVYLKREKKHKKKGKENKIKEEIKKGIYTCIY